jgi:hypothetical protein
MQLTVTVSSWDLEFNKTRLRRVLRAAGKEIVTTAKGLLSQAGSGRKYGSHTASAPGNPPAKKTGKLAQSFSLAVTRHGDAVAIADLAYYARALEGGSQGGGGGKGSASVGREHKRGGAKGKPQTLRMMQPRPFLSAAVAKDWPSISQRIGESIAQDIDLKKK